MFPALDDQCGKSSQAVIDDFEKNADEEEAKDWVEASKNILSGIRQIVWVDLNRSGYKSAKEIKNGKTDNGHKAVEIKFKTGFEFFIDDWLIGGVGRGPDNVFFKKDIPHYFVEIDLNGKPIR